MFFIFCCWESVFATCKYKKDQIVYCFSIFLICRRRRSQVVSIQSEYSGSEDRTRSSSIELLLCLMGSWSVIPEALLFSIYHRLNKEHTDHTETHHQSLCHTLGISDLEHLTIRCCPNCLSYQSPSSLSISGKLIIRSFQAKLSHSLLQLSSAQTQGKICNDGNVELSFDLGHGTVNQINCVPSCATLFILSTFHSLFKVTSSCTGMHSVFWK